MSHSFSFDSVDMSTYGLVVKKRMQPFSQITEASQLLNRAYGLNSVRPAGIITLEIEILSATLISDLDSIKAALNKRGERQLSLDYFTNRYWMVRFSSLDGKLINNSDWVGDVIFIAHDPAAYSTTETDHDHTVDEDPEAITETAGGTEIAKPVYTLTCDDTLSDTTVIIENETTGETLQWEGSLVSDDVLLVDATNKIVKLNDVLDMFTVSGQFPTLLPGANTINVSGFSGNFNATYRARYV